MSREPTNGAPEARDRLVARFGSEVPGWCEALAALDAVPRMCAGRTDEGTRFLITLAAGTSAT
ncbi:hypothetical protein ABZ845_00875 [Streptomyces sp. NPDC047022]|uniref:hypothetical protein n=1 Tax=Streptomyces sp. NPDC047022 TaxID=3155737 RepID=UPI00340F41B7